MYFCPDKSFLGHIMKTNVQPISADYMSQLLSLTNESKLRIVHMLTQSMLEDTHISRKRKSTKAFIESISLKGGEPVPADADGIASLIVHQKSF